VPYPVTFEADYVEKRSRLTTFFRLLLAIPHLIFVYLYQLAAGVVVLVAWFVLLFTGRWPLGMYDFVAGSLRYSTRVYGYTCLLTDAYPPFSGDPTISYPIRLNIAAPKPEYSRLKVLFRIILAIPVAIITYAMQIVAEVGALLAWFAIVVLGRQPKGLQDMIVLGLSYQQRAYSYIGLITEDWPPFVDDSAKRVEEPPSFGALPSTPPAAGVPEAAPPPPAPEAAPPPPASEAPPTPPETPPPPDRSDDDEPPPGPFGPSSTNP
jgi:hypothetical protein